MQNLKNEFDWGRVWKFCMKIGGQIYKGGGHFKKGGLIKKFIKPVLISLSHNDFEFEMDLNDLFPFFPCIPRTFSSAFNLRR